jgi:hypothetical protein
VGVMGNALIAEPLSHAVKSGDGHRCRSVH